MTASPPEPTEHISEALRRMAEIDPHHLEIAERHSDLLKRLLDKD
jgi:hypothetical protein